MASATAAAAAKDDITIDDNLYSRQRYVLGDQAMKSMARSTVFLSGLSGLGVEIAKNVALAGVGQLVLHDTKVASWLDLSSQFYLRAEDVGKKNRAEASLAQVSELNRYTKVSTSNVDLATNPDVLKDYRLVVLVDAPLSLQQKVNAYCRTNKIGFIATESRGAFVTCFVDFGEHIINDKDGADPKDFLLAHVSDACPALVSVPEKQRHDLEDGTVVRFREMKGMDELNNNSDGYVVETTGPETFKLFHRVKTEPGKKPDPKIKPQPVDGSKLPPYIGGSGGYATEVKVPQLMEFRSLADELKQPSLLYADEFKFGNPHQIHLGLIALHQYAEKNNALPAPWNKAHADELLKIAATVNAEAKLVDPIDQKLLTYLSYTAQGSLVGLTSFMGGVVAQEVLKGLTGKYTPIKQWLLVDAVEVCPPLDTVPAQFALQNNRYDGQRVVLGADTCARLAKVRLFMIGAGAIGCEMIKNYAMMGISGNDEGKITVTDNDLIEMSNLNRQFLFRKKDIQHPKSKTAAAAALAMNPDLHIDAEEDRVGKDTEDKFTDEFIANQDVMVNALDNVQARLYVDSRCVRNRRPLLESGTLGCQGHVQIIVPHSTESYGSKVDPPEKSVPFCTLKTFPSAPEHCVQWARDFSFESIFADRCSLVNEFLAPGGMKNLTSSKMRDVVVTTKLLRRRPATFDDCVLIACDRFDTYFCRSMRQLMHTYPLDHKTTEGTAFWVAPKRPPTPIVFNPKESDHIDFVVAYAALLAFNWRLAVKKREELQAPAERARIAALITAKWKPRDWAPKKKIYETDPNAKGPKAGAPAVDLAAEETAKFEADFVAQVAQLQQITSSLPSGFTLQPHDFEKDDDSNFHIDYLAAASNLRARVYGIAPKDRLETKRIAGRIIPAIATTTAAVSGLVSVELIKVVLKAPKVDLKNLFMNLGISLFVLSEPDKAEAKKITDKVSYTQWDLWEVNENRGEMTLRQFKDAVKAKSGLDVNGVYVDTLMVYLWPLDHALDESMAKLIRDATKGSTVLPKTARYVDLNVHYTSEVLAGPKVCFYFPKPAKKQMVKKGAAKAAAGTISDAAADNKP